MDTELHLSLKAEVYKKISQFFADGYCLIGDIFMTINEETGIAEVDVFLINVHNSSLPLEKYYRYRLINNGIMYYWIFLDNDN